MREDIQTVLLFIINIIYVYIQVQYNMYSNVNDILWSKDSFPLMKHDATYPSL